MGCGESKGNYIEAGDTEVVRHKGPASMVPRAGWKPDRGEFGNQTRNKAGRS